MVSCCGEVQMLGAKWAGVVIAVAILDHRWFPVVAPC